MAPILSTKIARPIECTDPRHIHMMRWSSGVSKVVVGGMYRHHRTKQFYRVIRIARPVESPKDRVVVYEQMAQSKLLGTEEMLSPGTCWTRDIKSFLATNESGERKFVLLREQVHHKQRK